MRDIFTNNQDRIKKFRNVKILNEMAKGKCKHPLYQKDFLNNILCVGDVYIDMKYTYLGELTVAKLTPHFVYGKNSKGAEFSTKPQYTLLIREGDFMN